MHTDLHRLLVTDSKEADYSEQVIFFMKKMRARGHDIRRFSEVFQRYPHSRRKLILTEGATARTKPANLGLTIKYVKGIERCSLHKLNRCASHLLAKLLGGDTQATLTTRFSVGKNLFRLLYRHTW